ncbi:hypothetical protein GYB22_03315 [bacterium]|nr:hypothetical protein [bacterium]
MRIILGIVTLLITWNLAGAQALKLADFGLSFGSTAWKKPDRVIFNHSKEGRTGTLTEWPAIHVEDISEGEGPTRPYPPTFYYGVQLELKIDEQATKSISTEIGFLNLNSLWDGPTVGTFRFSDMIDPVHGFVKPSNYKVQEYRLRFRVIYSKIQGKLRIGASKVFFGVGVNMQYLLSQDYTLYLSHFKDFSQHHYQFSNDLRKYGRFNLTPILSISRSIYESRGINIVADGSITGGYMFTNVHSYGLKNWKYTSMLFDLGIRMNFKRKMP